MVNVRKILQLLNSCSEFSNKRGCAALQNSHDHLVATSQGSSMMATWQRSLTTTATSPSARLEPDSMEVQRLFEEVRTSLDSRVAPRKATIGALLERVATAEDLRMAMSALERLRIDNASIRRQYTNFHESVALRFVTASCRSGNARLGLVALRPNVYGLTPCLASLHILLRNAGEQKDCQLVADAVQLALDSGLSLSAESATLALQACEEAGNSRVMFRVLRKLHAKDVHLDARLYDLALDAAAQKGNAVAAFQIHNMRAERHLALSALSAVATSKVHVLRNELDMAATAIHASWQEEELREDTEMFVQQMMLAWPRQILSSPKRDTAKVSPAQLSERLQELLGALKEKGMSTDYDVEMIAPAGDDGLTNTAVDPSTLAAEER